MSLAAESPSPASSSSSGSDDFAALLDAELELASAADSPPGDGETDADSVSGEEGGGDGEGEGEEDVEALGSSRYLSNQCDADSVSGEEGGGGGEGEGEEDVEALGSSRYLAKQCDADSVSGEEGSGGGEGEGEEDVEARGSSRTKKRRVDDLDTRKQLDEGTALKTPQEGTSSSKDVRDDICPPHPGFFGGLCFRCGKREEGDELGVAVGYIHKDLRLGTSEIDRLRGANLKDLLSEKKLILILDLDHTLINSTKLHDLSPAEQDLGKHADASEDDRNRSFYTLPSMQMLTKLRPFVQNFLKEASNLFEMYIYTMGDKAYAIEIAKILDPRNVYFNSKVISNSDCTKRHLKGLDVVLGAESLVVILDDTEYVWQKHNENLILMERYHFFASSCRQFGFGIKSLSELTQDERESDGALATILEVLKRVHQMFFDPMLETSLSSRDVREVIKKVRREVLQGCKIVFSRVFPSNTHPEDQPIWKMAEQLGALCCADVDSTVTHVVAMDSGTEKARWAVENKKFLVNPRWIEAASFRWQRQKEEEFLVANQKEKSRE